MRNIVYGLQELGFAAGPQEIGFNFAVMGKIVATTHNTDLAPGNLNYWMYVVDRA